MAESIRAIWIPALVLLLLIVVWPRIAASRAWTVAALGSILFLALMHQLLFGTIAEDAFITFRYAMNLASGRGPVFNPGERVEGYSDFLWMVTLGGVHRLLYPAAATRWHRLSRGVAITFPVALVTIDEHPLRSSTASVRVSL